MSTIQSRIPEKKGEKPCDFDPKNSHENVVPLPTYLIFHLILRLQNFSTIKPTRCLGKGKIETGKGKEMRGGEIAKRKSQDCRVCLISAQPQASEAIILHL